MTSIIEAAAERRAARAKAEVEAAAVLANAAATSAAPPPAPMLHAPAPLVQLLGTGADERARWDAFVQKAPSATFFHRAGWQRVIEQAFGHKTWFFYVEEDGEITGVLPLAQIKSRLFGHSLISLPFCVYGGVAAETEAARKLLDAAAEELAASLGAGHLEYHNYAPANEGDPKWLGKDLYYTFRKAQRGRRRKHERHPAQAARDGPQGHQV
jgi:CelD/BcsL family acetyltransferase involved in cellulose biosynthesis